MEQDETWLEPVGIEEIKSHIHKLLELIKPEMEKRHRFSIAWDFIQTAWSLAIALMGTHRIYRVHDGRNSWYAVEED